MRSEDSLETNEDEGVEIIRSSTHEEEIVDCSNANGGAIINISSTASVNKSPTSEPYGAAKAGLNGLTRSFAAAYGPKVRVNCIMAGPFLTDIADAWDMEAFNERARTSIPMQRGGQPDEVVAAALYFAGDGAGFTTGAILAIDGGAH